MQVPQQSRLLGHEQQAIPLAGAYVSPDIPRDLRIGAKVISSYHKIFTLLAVFVGRKCFARGNR